MKMPSVRSRLRVFLSGAIMLLSVVVFAARIWGASGGKGAVSSEHVQIRLIAEEAQAQAETRD